MDKNEAIRRLRSSYSEITDLSPLLQNLRWRTLRWETDQAGRVRDTRLSLAEHRSDIRPCRIAPKLSEDLDGWMSAPLVNFRRTKIIT